MKSFHCRDAGLDCDFVARGSTSQDILKQVAPHAEREHGMAITPELARKVDGFIRDEEHAGYQPFVSQSG